MLQRQFCCSRLVTEAISRQERVVALSAVTASSFEALISRRGRGTVAIVIRRCTGNGEWHAALSASINIEGDGCEYAGNARED